MTYELGSHQEMGQPADRSARGSVLFLLLVALPIAAFVAGVVVLAMAASGSAVTGGCGGG
jgi:hypothetical protein